MPKGRRTDLPPVTDEDVQSHADRMRRTPSGGWAWKCAHCNRYASSETQAGKYVCYAHGGNRKVQRDPKERAKARTEGKKPPKPVGRPMKHGFYSGSETKRVQDVVREYQQQHVDPDDTDEDMLHLRARVRNLLALEPLIDETRDELASLLEEVRAWRNEKVVDADGVTVATVAQQLDRMPQLNGTVDRLTSSYRRLLTFSAEVEERHREIVRLAKVRAETRYKDRAARELSVIALLMERFKNVLGEQLPPQYSEPLLKRLARDLDEVPTRVLELPDSVTVEAPSGKGRANRDDS